jgi:hypothetical protein
MALAGVFERQLGPILFESAARPPSGEAPDPLLPWYSQVKGLVRVPWTSWTLYPLLAYMISEGTKNDETALKVNQL